MGLKTRLKNLEQTISEQKTTEEWDEACICFPSGELLDLTSEERTAAAELECPLHGRRLPFEVYRAQWLRDRAALATRSVEPENRRIDHSTQYRRALAATHEYIEGIR